MEAAARFQSSLLRLKESEKKMLIVYIFGGAKNPFCFLFFSVFKSLLHRQHACMRVCLFQAVFVLCYFLLFILSFESMNILQRVMALALAALLE